MEEQEQVFTALTFEDYDYTETTSAWHIKNMDNLKTKKYGARFNPKIDKVYDWVYEHRDIIQELSFEEQEQMMIADGVLTPEDI